MNDDKAARVAEALGCSVNYLEQSAIDRIAAILDERDALQKRNQREQDLIRYCRAELHEAKLITDEEYAELVPPTGSPQRLRDYDALRAELAAAKAWTEHVANSWRAEVADLKTEVERLRGVIRRTIDAVLREDYDADDVLHTLGHKEAQP